MNKILRTALAIAGAVFLTAGYQTVVHADTPRTDMVDVSNHNGAMSAPEWTDMRNTYGVKAMVTKISEGTTYHDWTAKGNIASAQQAGIYVNGYHYLHATTVAGAIAEAQYAVANAKADGLPVGAVLVADIEEPAQMAMGANMQAVATAFENEVARVGGYRSTSYTMGSHMDVTPAGEKAWIASYPYTPTSAQNYYSTEHAWQWSSSATFRSSYGVFDVNQLYDDFFTSGQTPVVDSADKVDPVVKPAKPAKVSAIDQFKNAGDRFTAYGTFKVDKIAYVNGMWQAINYDMAGGKDADWTMNGIPLAILDNVTRGNVAPTKVGDTVKFMAGYDNGTIDAYDGASNGAGVVEGRYGMVWYNAGELLKK